jgi:hypothetical protein
MQIESISRRRLFDAYPLVRAEIQYFQQQEASYLRESDPAYWKRIRQWYDLYTDGENHSILSERAFAVLAYPAITRLDYTRHFIPTLIRCFQRMGISQWIVAQPLALPWTEYGFANERKRSYFNRITNYPQTAVGFAMDASGLQHVLQACLFAHPDGPTFLFFAKDHPAEISASICKDGNVHLNLAHNAIPLLKSTMDQRGILVGDLPLFSIHYRARLR